MGGTVRQNFSKNLFDRAVRAGVRDDALVVFRQAGINQAGRSQRTHFVGIPAVKERGQMVHLETDVILKHQVRLIKPGSRAQVLRPIRDFDQHRPFIQEGSILCGQPGERINSRRRQVRRRQGGGIGGVSPGG